MINSQKTLVAYLDIMGYREIIKNKTPEEFYASIVSVFGNVQKLIDFLPPEKIKSFAQSENQNLDELLID